MDGKDQNLTDKIKENLCFLKKEIEEKNEILEEKPINEINLKIES